MYELKKKLERYLQVYMLGPGFSSYKKRIYRAAVSQRLRNTRPEDSYRLWRVVVCFQETSLTRIPYPRWAAEQETIDKKK
jgi:hypothetical protein